MIITDVLNEVAFKGYRFNGALEWLASCKIKSPCKFTAVEAKNIVIYFIIMSLYPKPIKALCSIGLLVPY